MTMRDPTRMPMRTQRRRPKIEVRLESSVSTKAASYTENMVVVEIKTKKQKESVCVLETREWALSDRGQSYLNGIQRVREKVLRREHVSERIVIGRKTRNECYWIWRSCLFIYTLIRHSREESHKM